MINSMTGFARTAAQEDWGNATWEVRSVNHRYLDCNIRLPDTFRALEPELREIARKYLSRGRIDCFLKYQPGEAAAQKLVINKSLLQQLKNATAEITAEFSNTAPIDPMKVLSWNNILQVQDVDTNITGKKILQLFETTLKKLVEARATEGAALKQLIVTRLESLTTDAQIIKSHLPEIVKQRRAKIIAHLDVVKGELDPIRLEQEMILFVQKIDVAEELDRLETHVKETFRTLEKGGAVGKRLDFLMQELNREANTMASKSAAQETTHAAIALKVVIEQMREQVQNIE